MRLGLSTVGQAVVFQETRDAMEQPTVRIAQMKLAAVSNSSRQSQGHTEP